MHTGPHLQAAAARGRRRFRRLIAAFVVGALAAALVAIPALAQASTATLSTDKPDYAPEQTVHFTGTGFDPSTTYAFPVLRPDGSIVHGDGSFTPGWDLATSDASGNLAYDYQLDGIQGSYEGRAYPAGWSGDWSQAPIANVAFTDAGSANIDQCRNGPFSAPVACTGAAWVNGNANSTQAHYREGDSLPYRVRFAGVLSGSSNFITISYGTTKAGKHAIDYLTTYNRTETTADPCSGVSGCSAFTTFPIPLDPNVTVPQAAGVFTCFGCTITSVSPYTLNGTYAGDSDTTITINFTATATNPVIAWGGHIASQFDWGDGNAAGNISGSPYHTSLDDTNLHGGAQDRQLQAAAVAGPPTIVTQVNDSSISPGDSVTDTATLTGTHGVPLGTVTFFVCGPDTTGPPDCTTGGTQVGSPVAVDSTLGTATSDAFTPGTASSNNGYYCFRAEYTPDPSVFYSIGKETNQTTECFQQVAVGVGITKNFDQDSYVIGDTISLNITVTSLGPGTAKNVVVTDQLEAPLLNWTVDAANSDAGCSIDSSKLLTCLWGDMGPLTSKTVIVTATATTDGIGCVDNTAFVNTDNAGSSSATDHLMVYGTNVKVTVTPEKSTLNAGDGAGLTFKLTVPTAPNRVAAQNATLSAQLRSGITWSVDDTTHCGINGSNLLSCTWASIPLGGFVTAKVTGTTSAADSPSFKTTATVGASNEGPNALSNNTSGATIKVNSPDIYVLKSAQVASVTQPSPIGFSIVVKNQGIGTAYGVTITDTVPTNTGLSWSIDPAHSDAGCTISAGTLSCNFGNMAYGQSHKVRITSATTSAACGTVNNTASTAATNEPSSKLANNSSSASITVKC